MIIRSNTGCGNGLPAVPVSSFLSRVHVLGCHLLETRMNWYYAKDKKQIGPVQVDELKRLIDSNQIGGTDLVWNKAMGKTWARVTDVPELAMTSAAAPVAAEKAAGPAQGGKLRLAARPPPVAATISPAFRLKTPPDPKQKR